MCKKHGSGFLDKVQMPVKRYPNLFILAINAIQVEETRKNIQTVFFLAESNLISSHKNKKG